MRLGWRRPAKRAGAPPALDRPSAMGLPVDLLASVRRLEIRARRLVTSELAGEYRSVFRGFGMEFAEAREYVPGDDVRAIDWNVTARMGTPWLKEFVEERELHVVCAVDVSASQLAAGQAQGRLGAAAELCALLTLAAAYSGDRSGLLTFSDGVERYVPPAKGKRHALRIVREVLSGGAPGAQTSLAAACDYLARVLVRRTVVVLISDFFDEGYAVALRDLARRHEVLALTLVDPLDEELPSAGLVEVEDAERGGQVLLDTADAGVRARYAAAAAARAEARRHALTSAGVDEVVVRLDEDRAQPLLAYFRAKAGRT